MEPTVPSPILRSASLLLFGLLAFSHSATAIIVSGSNPNDPIYAASGFTGVGFSVDSIGSCSGSLLSTGRHFLTAAHCVSGASGTATVNFTSGANSFSYTSTAMTVNPNYITNDFLNGADLAIITLNSVADVSIDRYSLYSNTNEMTQTARIVGYGREGTGASGGDGGTFGTKRQGQNVIDSILNSKILYYDFDNGLAAQNSLGGLGLGVNEVGIYKGDSGGPSFLNGQIAGIHSFISCSPGQNNAACGPPDIDGSLNGSFGETFGDTRVSTYATWINSVIDPNPVIDPNSVPEPSTYATGLLALAFFAAKARKTRS